MANRTDAVVFQLEDYLISIVQAAANPGHQLAGVVNVENAAPPELGTFPAVGVVFDRFKGVLVATGPTYERVAPFILTVSVQQPYDATNPDTEQRARRALRQYVDDGHGNGLIPLLKTDPRLGGYVDKQWVEDSKSWCTGGGAPQPGPS